MRPSALATTAALLSAAALAGVTALPACNGVRDLGQPAGPVLTLHGRVEGTWPERAQRVRAAILWAAVPQYVPYCHDYGPDPREPNRYTTQMARKGCRDPFEVVPGAVGPSAPVDPITRTFTIEIPQLPEPGLLVGPPAARVVYGSIVVYEDLDANGDLRVTNRSCRRFVGRGGGGGGGNNGGVSTGIPIGPGISAGADAGVIAEIGPTRETIYGATFRTLRGPQLRLAYVEGAFDTASTYYPHSRCGAAPPPGFSLWEMGSLHDPGATCLVRPATEEVVVQLDADPKLVNLTCQQSPREIFPRNGGSVRLGQSGVQWECTDSGDLVVVDMDCVCPELNVYSLRGCAGQVACTEYDWDLWSDPSEDAAKIRAQWPCPDPRTGIAGP